MPLRIYNTLTKQKEPFVPVEPGKVGIYLCGPTVYKPPHVGHMVGPVIFDAIKRYLQFNGFAVNWVLNITDVEDKLINEARERGTTVPAVAEEHTRQYMQCLQMLGIDTVDRYPKASEHIPEIVALCEKLIASNHAYAADGNVWFAVASDADYGKLSHRRPEEQESGTRDLEGSGKRNPADFALWKSAKPGEPAWDSPWGKGRPGWHIECSAMSMKYLGQTFDLHGGGMDLIFPHHENELAQSESATGKPFVKYWLHNNLTRVRTKLASGEWKQEKESKSLGNVRDAKQFIEQAGADLLRYLILSTHYRSPIDSSDEVIAACKKGLATFTRLFERIERLTGAPVPLGEPAPVGVEPLSAATAACKARFVDMMDDDFNTAGAIANLYDLASAINAFLEQQQVEKDKKPQNIQAALAATITLKNLGALLGFFRVASPAPAAEDQGLVNQLMDLLIAVRAQARKDKNFATADAVRKGLAAIGITLEDRADGTSWRKE